MLQRRLAMLQFIFLLLLAVRADGQPGCGDVFDACNGQYGPCFGGSSSYYCSDECKRQIGGCSLAISNYAEVSSICSLATSSTCDTDEITPSPTRSPTRSPSPVQGPSSTGSPEPTRIPTQSPSPTRSPRPTRSSSDGSSNTINPSFNSIVLYIISGAFNSQVASCKFASCSNNGAALARRVRQDTCSKILDIDGVIKVESTFGYNIPVGATGIRCNDSRGVRQLVDGRDDRQEDYYVYVTENTNIDFSGLCNTGDLDNFSNVARQFQDVCNQVISDSAYYAERACVSGSWEFDVRSFGSKDTCMDPPSGFGVSSAGTVGAPDATDATPLPAADAPPPNSAAGITPEPSVNTNIEVGDTPTVGLPESTQKASEQAVCSLLWILLLMTLYLCPMWTHF